MAHFLNTPENVMIQHIFPCLNHNDLLRLRRVSKQTKALADAYLWTPRPGHQGTWELKIDSSKDQTLEAFLGMDVPPPSRLHIANRAEKGPSEPRSFFEDEHLEEFMRRYSKYVTSLRVDKLFIPFTTSKETGFYESLVNLEELCCNEMITVGGASQFEMKTRRAWAEGSFLIRPTFNKLKIFKLDYTDCMDSMYTFINGVSNNLDELLHPFKRTGNDNRLNGTNFAPVQELIERRGVMKSQRKLMYDWTHLPTVTDPLELLRVYASCRDNGVIIKNLMARHLDCLLCDENGRIDKEELLDPFTGEWIINSRVNYQRNLFVGNLLHSLTSVTDNVFLMDLPALEDISILSRLPGRFQIRPRRGYGDPQWPNLKKMSVQLNYYPKGLYRFLWGKQMKRPKLEELSLNFRNLPRESKLPSPNKLGNCCENLKKLTIYNCDGDNDFFVGLWEGLPLLEDVTLKGCPKLTNNSFIGIDKRRPVILNLKKLKHLSILNLEAMPRMTDTALKNVFLHLKLSSFKLSSARAIKRITVNGIIKLFTGPFAETIEKIDLDKLKLEGVSEKQLKQVVSCFWSSKGV